MATYKYDPLDVNDYLPTDGSVPVALADDAVQLAVASGEASQRVSLTGYEKIAVVYEGDSATEVDYLELLGNQDAGSATIEIVADSNASSGYALKMTEAQTLIFGTRISYVPTILKKIVLKARADASNTTEALSASVMAYSDGVYIAPDGTISKDFVHACTDANILTTSYATYTGYIKDVASGHTGYVEPASDPNTPSPLPDETDEIALVLESTGGTFYIDVIALEEVENTIRDIPDGQTAYDISQDDKVTPGEKVNAKQLWDIIVTEGHPTTGTLSVQANNFSVSTTSFATAYSDLDTYLNTTLNVFSSLTTTTDITRATWDSYWKAYYDARTTLIKDIETANKARLDTSPRIAIVMNYSDFDTTPASGSGYVHGLTADLVEQDIDGRIIRSVNGVSSVLTVPAQAITGISSGGAAVVRSYLIDDGTGTGSTITPALYDYNNNKYYSDYAKTTEVSSGYILGWVERASGDLTDAEIYSTAYSVAEGKTKQLINTMKYLHESTDGSTFQTRAEALGIENSFINLAAYNGFFENLFTQYLLLNKTDVYPTNGTPEVCGGAGTTTTVVLGAGASAVDDTYNGNIIRIDYADNVHISQYRLIADYNGTSKTATVATLPVAPTTSDSYLVADPGSIRSEFYDAAGRKTGAPINSGGLYLNADGKMTLGDNTGDRFIDYDPITGRLTGNIEYDQWDLVIESDEDLALLYTGSGAGDFTSVLITDSTSYTGGVTSGAFTATERIDLVAHNVERFVGLGPDASVLQVGFTLSTALSATHYFIYGDSGVNLLSSFSVNTGTQATNNAWDVIYFTGNSETLSANNIIVYGDSVNRYGYGFNNLNRLSNCYVKDVNVGYYSCDYISNSQAHSCSLYGFRSCQYIFGTLASSAYATYNYYQCHKVSNAISFGYITSVSAGSVGFHYCNGISSSYSYNDYIGFNFCTKISSTYAYLNVKCFKNCDTISASEAVCDDISTTDYSCFLDCTYISACFANYGYYAYYGCEHIAGSGHESGNFTTFLSNCSNIYMGAASNVENCGALAATAVFTEPAGENWRMQATYYENVNSNYEGPYVVKSGDTWYVRNPLSGDHQVSWHAYRVD